MELELSLKGAEERSKELAAQYAEGRLHGRHEAALRTLRWGLYLHANQAIQPSAISAILDLWLLRAKVQQTVTRAMTDMKTHAAKSISQLKADAKAKQASFNQAEKQLTAQKSAITQVMHYSCLY